MRQQGRTKVENMRVEEELAAFRRGDAIQVGGAEQERPGPFGQPAGRGRIARPGRGRGLEDVRVDLPRRGFAQGRPKGAAQGVGAGAARKMEILGGAEMKTEAIEFESDHRISGAGIGALLLYNGMAFGSCFPLRDNPRGGCVSPSATPFLFMGGAGPDAD